MRLDENGKAGGSGRLDVEAVAANDAAADRLEHLGGFGRGESLQVGFEPLHGELRSKQLFDYSGEMAEDRRRTEIVLSVLRHEQIGPQVLTADRGSDRRPGLDGGRRQPFAKKQSCRRS